MKTQILDKLKQIESEYNVRVLFAVESGSRAWGFASPDSDYDIRFVYQRNTECYLSLWESKDTISFMTEDDLDGSGWDLRKALQLLAKSNASFLGWLGSPIVYIDRDGVLNKLKQLAADNFNPVAGFYHYFNMNKGFDELLGSENMTLKSYFYAIRTALCARWIQQFESIPPVEFRALYPLISNDDVNALDKLIALKANAAEKATNPIDKRLINLAKHIVQENNENKGNVKSQKANHKAFDHFFINQVL